MTTLNSLQKAINRWVPGVDKRDIRLADACLAAELATDVLDSEGVDACKDMMGRIYMKWNPCRDSLADQNQECIDYLHMLIVR